MRVLLVDHSRVSRFFWREHLMRSGHVMLEADNAEAALALLDRESVNWVLVAQTLAEVSGLELIGRMRANSAFRGLPVVLLYGGRTDSLVNAARELNVHAVVDKADAATVLDALALAEATDRKMKRGRILYLEDSPTAVYRMRETLMQSGLIVDHAKTGDEALSALQRWRYDLVVTDVHPEGGLNGADLIRSLKTVSGGESGPPVLGISASDSPRDRQVLFQAGIDDFVAKSALPEEINARVMALLAVRQGRDVAQGAAFDYETGLLRRILFIRMAEKMLGQARRHEFSVALALIRMGPVPEHGMESAAQMLSEFGCLIERSSRLGDLAGRWGAEEFSLLLDHCSPADAAERVRRLFAAARAQWTDAPSLPLAAGCAGGMGEDLVLPLLFEAARQACEEAARNHGGVVVTGGER